MLDVAIIGGGPAGLAAGIKAASEGLNAAIFEASDRLGGRCASSPRIENIPGMVGGVSGEEYGRALASQCDSFGCRLRTGARCVRVWRGQLGHDGPVLTFDVNGELHDVVARTALITTGLVERKLRELTGVEDSGRVRYSCRPDDLKRHRGERLLFIGGGNSSAQLGLVAAEHGAQVTILATRELGYNVSAFLLQQVEAHPNVAVIVGKLRLVTHDPLNDDRMRVWFHLDHDRWSESFHHVYAFAGGVADVPFFDGLKDEDGKILTGADVDGPEVPYLTSEPGVFAAGDIRAGNTGSVAVAVGEGTQAIQTIAKVWLPSRYGALEPLARN